MLTSQLSLLGVLLSIIIFWSFLRRLLFRHKGLPINFTYKTPLESLPSEEAVLSLSKLPSYLYCHVDLWVGEGSSILLIFSYFNFLFVTFELKFAQLPNSFASFSGFWNSFQLYSLCGETSFLSCGFNHSICHRNRAADGTGPFLCVSPRRAGSWRCCDPGTQQYPLTDGLLLVISLSFWVPLVVWRHLKFIYPYSHSSLRHNETDAQNSQLSSMPGKPVLSRILMGHALVVVCQLSSCGTWKES